MAEDPRRRFFTPRGTAVDQQGRVLAPRADAPRPFTAAAARPNLDRTSGERVDKRTVSAWQTEAWRFFDAIGEIHFSFETIGNILSRIRIYAAVMESQEAPPIPVSEYLEQIEEQSGQVPEHTRSILRTADQLVNDLVNQAEGGSGGLMRTLAINFGIAGEAYLVRHKDQWIVASCDELNTTGDKMRLQRDRSTKKNDVELEPNAFAARLWRMHPRRGNEPDSSLLGVLDVCSTIVLLEQSIRVMTRSRLQAGIVFVPSELSVPGREDSVEQIIVEAAQRSSEDEGAAATVVPIVVTGPSEAGKELKRVELGRSVDEVTINLLESNLGRLMAGIDIPKDSVEGMSGVKYSNAIVIHDDLYRSHIEPLALLIVDSLNAIYLRPGLKKSVAVPAPPTPPAPVARFMQQTPTPNGAKLEADFLNKIVIWFDPSAVIIRPDKSQAANEGHDRKLISDAAWRSARGFNEGDAPTDDELRIRLTLEKAQIPPDMASSMIEALDPVFFASQRQEAQAESAMPAGVSELLEGPGQGTPPKPAGAEATAMDATQQGAPFRPGGSPAPIPEGGAA